ncbi:hypothetical protein M422DRAFT_266609 [Sphaerobolus stellatus SS14]|uniref:Uncharacterized protein n=1 Tax=Sphaerobolus stellatus (strain SS14) TaxID=990650 RepID=A0A0C9V2H4_SPHS4|nr:hypothetical protein M422DRAFT_266609 [Sphaerobolus stellatus SS14]
MELSSSVPIEIHPPSNTSNTEIVANRQHLKYLKQFQDGIPNLSLPGINIDLPCRSFILFPPPFKDEEDNKLFAVDFGALDVVMKFVVEKGPDGKDKVVGIALKDVWGPGNRAEILKGEDKESTEVWFDCVGEF